MGHRHRRHRSNAFTFRPVGYSPPPHLCQRWLTDAKPVLSAVSRSGLRILHLDRNEYYGGDEAALSLAEADSWAAAHAQQSEQESSTSEAHSRQQSCFSHAVIVRNESKGSGEDAKSKQGILGPARAYSLALAPQIVYARSNLLPALVSSRTHSQLEFQAVGPWFHISGSSSRTLSRVPGGREDIFQDTSLNLRAKGAVMKFLRFVGNYEEKEEEWRELKDLSLSTALEQKFGLPAASHGPLLALTLVASEPGKITVAEALPRIARHLRSIGVFGAGFGAVFPKFGGLAEVAQVACRACAVGGGVYVLGTGILSCQKTSEDCLTLELSGGEKVSTKQLVGSRNDLPTSTGSITVSRTLARSISIVSSPLTWLFPPTSEGGVTPAEAVVVVPSTSDPQGPPVHILVHSSESGDCPTGQCKLLFLPPLTHRSLRRTKMMNELSNTYLHCLNFIDYKNISDNLIFCPAQRLSDLDETAFTSRLADFWMPSGVLYASVLEENSSSEKKAATLLNEAIQLVLQSAAAQAEMPEVLWNLSYRHTVADQTSADSQGGSVTALRPLSLDLAFEDAVLDEVRSAWLKISKDDPEKFMRFEAREGADEDDENM